MKKCKKCGAPLEGFLYNTIGKLMGIKPSASDPETCNKCAEDKTEEAPKAEEKTPEVATPAEPIETQAEEKEDTSL